MLLISRKCVVRCIGTRYLPVPRIDEIHIDWRVLSFAAVVSMLTESSFGLIPIREISRIGIRDAINRAGSRGSGGAGTSRMDPSGVAIYPDAIAAFES